MKITSNILNIKEKIITQVNSLWRDRIYAFITVMACGLYSLLTSLRTMPFAEGWYTYYSQCINNGEIVYKDFDYLFTPLYINFIALFTRIFGYKIIYLRLLGVFTFCVIAWLLFLTIKEIFNVQIATVVTIPTMMYLQSEVVQIFYDYIRFMDVMSVATLLFLAKFIKELKSDNDKKKRKYLMWAGVFNAALILVKQNVGIVFLAYVIILLIAIAIVKRVNRNTNIKNIGWFLLGVMIPIAITLLLMLINGSLFGFISQTGADAIAAKGGVLAILFGWFPNNAESFISQIIPAIAMLVLFLVMYLISKIYSKHAESKVEKLMEYIAILVPILAFVGFILLHIFKDFAIVWTNFNYLSTYNIFLVVVPIFWIYVIKVIVAYRKKEKINTQDLLYIAMSGAYFAISWSCGMSAGLAEGQATFGLAFALALLLTKCDFKYGSVFKILVGGLCLFMTMQYASKKMVDTYQWWGMTDSDYWSSTEKIDDIPLLKGIKMSETTKAVYEDIYSLVQEKTDEDDSIYCFPQIPIFYSLCDRTDPGVRAKVQWFDVASDTSIINDMEVLENNPPSVIIIYETEEYAYNGHEFMFRSGEISATRRMKQFLLEYVTKNGYELYKEVNKNQVDKFLVYYKSDSKSDSLFKGFSGEGTSDKPYRVSSAEDLLFISESVYMGNDYSDVYFEQTCDIDLGSVENWAPIGRDDEYGVFGFNGIYNGNGYSIKNINSADLESAASLFVNLDGMVTNLVIEDSYFEGATAAAVATNVGESDAIIANCIVRNSTIRGTRAAAVAYGFSGSVYNCYVNSSVYGQEASLVKLDGGKCINVFSKGGNVIIPIDQVDESDVAFYNDTLEQNSIILAREYNNLLSSDDESLEAFENVKILYWKVTDNEPTMTKTVLKGKGTAKKPYLINDEKDFENFRDMVNAGITFDGAFIEQKSDIDLSGVDNFIPVGCDSDCPFKGIYNGAGYSIKNLYMLSENNENMALFNYLDGSVINLTVKDAWIGGSCVSIIAGEGEGQVVNCFAAGILYGYNTNGIAYSVKSVSNCASLISIEKGTENYGISRYAAVNNCFSNIVTDGISEMLGSESISKLNDYVSNSSKCIENIRLCNWDMSDGEIKIIVETE